MIDASPLIYLAQVEGLLWLEKLFGQVHMTAQVHHEVLTNKGKPGEWAISEALQRGSLRLLERDWPGPQFPWLGEGEASCIRAAVNLGQPCLILLDDKEARRTAEGLSPEGVAVSGTVAIVGAAKQRGLIPFARNVFDELQRKGFRIADDLVQGVLESLGEQVPEMAKPRRATTSGAQKPRRPKPRRRRST